MPKYLIVIVPESPSALREKGRPDFSSSWSQPTPPTVRTLEADSEEEALDKTSIPTGATVYVATMDNVHEYRVPEKPKPESVDRQDSFF